MSSKSSILSDSNRKVNLLVSRWNVNLSVFCVQVPKNTDLGADAERVRKEEQKRIDEAEVLSEDEINEKEDLLRQVRVNTMWLMLTRKRIYWDR